MTRIGIGLYGTNGHQIGDLPINHPDGHIVAIAGMDPGRLPEHWRSVRVHPSLAALLSDPAVHLVSLCSPRRADQADDAIRCLAAGRHVYAEKPCALCEADLDRILAAAAQANRRFHEMAGTVCAEPWWTMRRLVAEGAIGNVIQVWAQKSYPLHDDRPQDENIDGGLLLQAGVHALRFIEHVSGTTVATSHAIETQYGNRAHPEIPDRAGRGQRGSDQGGKDEGIPEVFQGFANAEMSHDGRVRRREGFSDVPNRHAGDLRIAVAISMTLANGGLAQATINYCQPEAFGSWGNDQLRLFGSKGLIEAVDNGQRRRLVTHDHDEGAFAIGPQRPEYHDLLLASLARGEAMPWTSAVELSPTRAILRARTTAR